MYIPAAALEKWVTLLVRLSNSLLALNSKTRRQQSHVCRLWRDESSICFLCHKSMKKPVTLRFILRPPVGVQSPGLGTNALMVQQRRLCRKQISFMHFKTTHTHFEGLGGLWGHFPGTCTGMWGPSLDTHTHTLKPHTIIITAFQRQQSSCCFTWSFIMGTAAKIQ